MNTIGVKEENVAGTHKRDFRNIRCASLPGSEFHGKISVAIGVISRHLQAQRQELHHPVAVQLYKLTIFSREHERRRVPEIYKAKIAVRMYFAVKHGRYFPRILFLAYPKCVASRDRMRQTQVDVFE